MSDWQPIETAPKDGTVFLAYWGDDPQFVAWVGDAANEVEYRRVGPFWNRRTERMVKSRETGFRVLMPPARGMGWGVHGNFAPFTPTHWMPLPEAPPAENAA
jgi:hypothetical protein